MQRRSRDHALTLARFALIAIAMSSNRPGWSQTLPQAHLDRITPLGGQAGSKVEMVLTGRDLEEVKTLRFDHPGLTAEFIEANKFRITIAKETPAGTYEVRAVGRHGISGSRLFA